MTNESVPVVTLVSNREAECDCGAELYIGSRHEDAIRRHSVEAHGGIQLLIVRAPS